MKYLTLFSIGIILAVSLNLVIPTVAGAIQGSQTITIYLNAYGEQTIEAIAYPVVWLSAVVGFIWAWCRWRD